MDHLTHLMPEHVESFFSSALVWWGLAAFVQSLPEPLPMSSRFYLWFYNFSHILAANTRQVVRREK